MVALEEIFDIQYGNKFDLNKMTFNNPSVNFVGRSAKNNAVTSYVDIKNNTKPFDIGLITVALGGSILASFVQVKSFYTGQNIVVLKPKEELTINQKLYYCMAIRNNEFRFSAFGREANRTLKNLLVPSIEEIPKWVEEYDVSRFDDAVKSKNKVNRKNRLENNFLYKNFVKLDNLFDVIYGANLELNRLEQNENGINFVSRTSKNNGVSAKVKKISNIEPNPSHVLSVAGGGSVLETFLQTEPFYSGRDLYYLKPKFEFSEAIMLFYSVYIRANMYRYNYGRQANRTLKALMLPKLNNGDIKEVEKMILSLPFSSVIDVIK